MCFFSFLRIDDFCVGNNCDGFKNICFAFLRSDDYRNIFKYIFFWEINISLFFYGKYSNWDLGNFLWMFIASICTLVTRSISNKLTVFYQQFLVILHIVHEDGWWFHLYNDRY